MFAICGKRSVYEALISNKGYAFQRLWIAQTREREDNVIREIYSQARRANIAIRQAAPRELDRFAPGFLNHQGVALELQYRPPEASLDDLLSQAQAQNRTTMIALDCVTDHQNIGAIVRSAALFGVSAVIAPRDRSAPLIHPTVWRIAQGAAEHVALITVANLARTLKELKNDDIAVIGVTERPQAQAIHKMAPWPAKVCLVFGSEAQGLRRLTLEQCDSLAKIAQQSVGHVDSLNLSHAATIALWEVSKSS